MIFVAFVGFFAHKMIYITMCQDYNSDVNKWISFVPICFQMIKSRNLIFVQITLVVYCKCKTWYVLWYIKSMILILMLS